MLVTSPSPRTAVNCRHRKLILGKFAMLSDEDALDQVRIVQEQGAPWAEAKGDRVAVDDARSS